MLTVKPFILQEEEKPEEEKEKPEEEKEE